MSLSLSERIQTGRIDRPDEWTMDGYSWEAKKLENKIAELETIVDDLQAYKDLAIELANRKGYDSLAQVFDDWEKWDLGQSKGDLCE